MCEVEDDIEQARRLGQPDKLALIAAHLKAMQPDMQRLAGIGDAMAESRVLEYIEAANVAQCTDIAEALAARLRTLASDSQYEDSANLDEAATLIADAVTDLHGVPAELEELEDVRNAAVHPFGCPCDSCVAMRSDVHHDLKRDGEMMRAA